MDAGHVYVIMVEAEKKGLRGTVNLVDGAKISFDFNSVGGETLSIAIQRNAINGSIKKQGIIIR